MTKTTAIERDALAASIRTLYPEGIFLATVCAEDGQYRFCRPGAGSSDKWETLDEIIGAVRDSADMGASKIKALWPDIDGSTLDQVRAMVGLKIDAGELL